MSYGAIISDFHYTIINEDEIVFWEELTKDILNHCYLPPSPLIAMRISKGKEELEALGNDYRNGKLESNKFYTKFNEIVLEGTDIDNINRFVKKYADESQKKLQNHLLDYISISKAHFKGIISTGYKKAIRNVLGIYEQVFNRIDANTITFMTDYNKQFDKKPKDSIRIVNGFHLSVNKHKGEHLEDLRKENKIKGKIVVIGDSEEDESMYQQPGVIPVVSNLATDDFKQKCAKLYTAEILENQKDFGMFLDKISKNYD